MKRNINQELVKSGIAAKALKDFLEWVAEAHSFGRGRPLKDEPIENLSLEQCRFTISYHYNRNLEVIDFKINVLYRTNDGRLGCYSIPVAACQVPIF